jgi:acyl carrier protein
VRYRSAVAGGEKIMSSVESDVYDIIAEKSAVDRSKLKRDAKLADLEIESLDVVEIIFAVEEKFDIHVPYNANDQELEFQTVGDVVDAVQKLIEEEGKTA